MAGTLFSAMGLTGFVSGAMFNPSVTISSVLLLYFQKNLKRETLLEHMLYFGFQCLFAFFGMLVAWFLTNTEVTIEVSDSFNTTQGFFAELIWTFLLVCAALLVGKWDESPLQAGGAVAAVLFSGAVAVGPITGASFNPAVSIASNLVTKIAGYNESLNFAVYIVAPVIGSVLAAFAVFIVTKDSKSTEREEKSAHEENNDHDATSNNR